MSSLIRATQTLLGLTLAIGVYTTWYLIYNNDTVELMKEIRNVEPHILPGTEAPLKKAYIGIGWIDHQLTVLTLFFWEAIDGSRPAASLFCFMFAGQAAAAWSILYIEGQRSGNHWRLVSFAMCWGLIMQMGAFAVFLPLYLIVHLSTSPTVLSRRAEDYVVDVPKLFSIPISLVVGYALPAVLLSLPAPSILTYDQKQTFLALWQAFPIWFEVLQQVFSFVFAKVRDRTSVSPASLQNPVRRTIETMRSVYMFVLAIAGVTRITTIMLSMTSKLFPAVFSQEFRGVLDPSNVFQDRSFFASDKMDSIGAGAFQFLQYDEIFGSVALIFWSLTLYLNMYLSTTTFDSWKALKVFSAFTVSTALFGPCGCAVCFIWARDELVFAAKEKYGKKSS